MSIHARIKKQDTAKIYRYSALVIKFAYMLRGKMSQSNYNFYQKTFNLTCNTTLIEYSSADTESMDGCMMETIAQVLQMINKLKVPDNDFHHEGNLIWGSHTIQDKLQSSFGSGNLTGYADDAFNLNSIVE